VGACPLFDLALQSYSRNRGVLDFLPVRRVFLSRVGSRDALNVERLFNKLTKTKNTGTITCLGYESETRVQSFQLDDVNMCVTGAGT